MAVDVTANPKIVVTLDSIIPLQEWVTIRTFLFSTASPQRVIFSLPEGYGNCDAAGNCGPGVAEPDRLDIGFLPCDVDQSSDVGPFDLLAFRQITNGVVPPPSSGAADYIDTNRNGSLDPFDLLVFRQLTNGVSPPATQVWNGQTMNADQP